MHGLVRSASETCCGCYKIAKLAYCITVRCLSKPNFFAFGLQHRLLFDKSLVYNPIKSIILFDINT